MGATLKYFFGSEAQILALTPESNKWQDKAFYYPSDKNYFYQVCEGQMKKYGDGSAENIGIGVNIDGKILGGVKSYISFSEVLYIPEYYEYNIHNLSIEGQINCNGIINIL